MLDLSLLVIPWSTAFAIVASVATIAGASIKIFGSRKALPKDYSKEIEGIRKELREVDRDIADLQAALEGKVDVQVGAMQKQLDDLKGHYNRLHQKMEKLTNIIIEHFSER